MKSLAVLLEYPRSSFFEDLDRVVLNLDESCPQAAASIRKFRQELAERSVSDMEELFTRTFDVAPIVCPYITAHIYGDENFDRGRLMSALSSKFVERGFEPGAELPDHIAILLRFAPYLDEDEISELSDFCLKEPLGGMVDSLREAGSPYLHVFEAIQQIIEGRSVFRIGLEGAGRHD